MKSGRSPLSIFLIASGPSSRFRLDIRPLRAVCPDTFVCWVRRPPQGFFPFQSICPAFILSEFPYALSIGSRNVKVQPRRGSLSTQILPRCACTSRLAIARPKPIPRRCDPRVQNPRKFPGDARKRSRSRIRHRNLYAIGMLHALAPAILGLDFLGRPAFQKCSSARNETFPPAGVCFSELSRRLATVCCTFW